MRVNIPDKHVQKFEFVEHGQLSHVFTIFTPALSLAVKMHYITA